MRIHTRSAVACFLGIGLLTTGCDPKQADEPAGSSQARLVISNSSTSALHLMVTDASTSKVLLDQSVDVGGTVLTKTFPTATYTFSADQVGGWDQRIAAVGSASARLTAGAVTQVRVVAPASGPLQIDVGTVPEVIGIDVETGSGASTGTVDVHITASSPAAGELSYFWSGAGLPGIVQGSSTLTLPLGTAAAAAGADGTAALHVVVQDAFGVATSADVSFKPGATSAAASIDPASSDLAVSPCLSAQATCAARCTLGLAPGWVGGSATADCLAGCGANLAACKKP